MSTSVQILHLCHSSLIISQLLMHTSIKIVKGKWEILFPSVPYCSSTPESTSMPKHDFVSATAMQNIGNGRASNTSPPLLREYQLPFTMFQCPAISISHPSLLSDMLPIKRKFSISVQFSISVFFVCLLFLCQEHDFQE